MRSNWMRRVTAVAAAAALACFLAPVGPVGASSAAAGSTGGAIVLERTSYPDLVIPLVSSGCSGTVTLDSTGTSANLTIWATNSLLVYGGSTYVVVVTRTVSTAGTTTGSSPAVLTGLDTTLKVEFHTLVSACTAGTKVCELNVTVDLDGFYSEVPATQVAIDTMFLSSSPEGPTVNTSCGLSVWCYDGTRGGSARVAGLTTSI